jgi:putative proteasome-type protease
LRVDEGLVFASDSRTNAGPDQVSVFGKMHVLLEEPDRLFVLLSAGNLATTQAVRTRIRHDLEFDRPRTCGHPEHGRGGRVPRLDQRWNSGASTRTMAIADRPHDGHFHPRRPDHRAARPAFFLIYPEGNYIRASSQTPFLQIGELKYGKPILDRLVRPEPAARRHGAGGPAVDGRHHAQQRDGRSADRGAGLRPEAAAQDRDT